MLMAKPSKKGAKSEAEVAAAANKKKDILDKVAQSNLPTKTILKELGISRSTYYSWLKRYQEEGEEGLLDSRSLPQAQEEFKEATPTLEEPEMQPSEVVVVEEVGEERLADPFAETLSEEEPTTPIPEKTMTEPEEPVPAPVEDEPEKREEVVVAAEMQPFGGGEQKKGRGRYALIAIMLLLVGLLFSISLSNHNNYQLRKSANVLTLWRGKFAPRGYEIVESFEAVEVGDSDVSSLTGRTFGDKDSANQAIFGFFIAEVNSETSQGSGADTDKIDQLLERAEAFINGNGKGETNLVSMRFQLAEKRVGMAELRLQKAYQKALPFYQEALRTGVADTAMLEAKVEAMQKALGLVQVVTPEAQAEEAGGTVAPEAAIEETEAAAVPQVQTEQAETTLTPQVEAEEAETTLTPQVEAEEAETTLAPQVEAEETETIVGVEPSAEEAETTAAATEEEAATETAEPEEEAKKPTSFLEWVRSKI
jgi:transposase-like protein